MGHQTFKDMLRGGLRWLAWIAAGTIALLGLLSIARVGHMFWVYHQLNGWVTTNLGVDSSIAMFLAVSGTAAVILVLPSVLWYALTGRRVRDAAIVAVGLAGVVALLVNTVGRDVCFDRASGRPLCYVAETPDGVQFSRTPGVDPKYGIPFVVYTQAMALARTSVERTKLAAVTSSSSSAGADGTFTVIVGRDWTEPIRLPTGRRVDWTPEAPVTYQIRTADGEVVTFPARTEPTIQVTSPLWPYFQFRTLDADSVTMRVSVYIPK